MRFPTWIKNLTNEEAYAHGFADAVTYMRQEIEAELKERYSKPTEYFEFLHDEDGVEVIENEII